MKNTRKVFCAAIAAVFAFSSAVCFGQSGEKSVNGPKALEEYLDSQPENSPNNPIKVTVSANDQMIKSIASTIGSAVKYVSLTLSGNVLTTIPESAFRNCTSLVSITIPDSVTTIGKRAFANCTSLASVTIGNSVTAIGVQVFENCTSLASVTIGNSVTGIEERAFAGFTSLASVTIGNSVTSIGERAFSKSGLTSITIPNSVASVRTSLLSIALWYST